MPTKNPQSFGYALRLHYPWQYKRFFSNSQVIRLSECTIFRVPNDLAHFRLGITLKARGSSVERNRTKRQIREQFRLLRPILGSFDYNVVVPGHKKLAYPYPEKLGRSIQSELPRALENR
jgi:ribonuclease P protein component